MELGARLVEVVEVEVGVAGSVDKFAGLEACYLCHHQQEQGIGGNVERHAEEAVGRALVELEREAAVGNVELEEGVAGGQGHVGHVGDVPGRHDEAARVGVLLDLAFDFGELVDNAAAPVGPRAPLPAIDGAELAVFVGPFVPDAHTVVLEVLNVGVAADEPEEFVDY